MVTEEEIHVRTAAGESAIWRVEYEQLDEACSRPWRLALVEPGGRRWEAMDHDLYHCLRAVRRQVEPAGILLCCQGATRNARP